MAATAAGRLALGDANPLRVTDAVLLPVAVTPADQDGVPLTLGVVLADWVVVGRGVEVGVPDVVGLGKANARSTVSSTSSCAAANQQAKRTGIVEADDICSMSKNRLKLFCKGCAVQ